MFHIREEIKNYPEVMAGLNDCSKSTKALAKVFFEERFNLPFAPAIHDKIFELIDGPANRVAIAAPRGFGKTSLVALAFMARYILFGITPFIVYINKSHDAASLQTENLKRELLSNDLIKKIFGNVKPEATDDFEEEFSKKAWVAQGTRVMPRGTGQQVRGILHKNSRPGLFVLDDIEDPQQITNEDYRRKTYEWLYADVLKAVPQVGKESESYKIVYIDTLKHEDSILQRLIESPDWESVRLEACDDDFNPTAPEFLSREKVLKEWEDYSNAGQSDVFFREMRNLPISTQDASFRDEYFRYYNIPMGTYFREGIDTSMTESQLNGSQCIENVVLVDPAKTVKSTSADTAIIGIGIDRTSQRIYIRDIDCGKWYPDEQYERTLEMIKRIRARALGWEVTGLGEYAKQPLTNFFHSRGFFIDIKWLDARGGHGEEKGKAMRVRSLVPYYRQGQIYHNKSCANIPVLEQQLRMFPRSKRWDVMDATAYIVQLLEEGGRYFSPIYEDADSIEAEYADITYDAPLAYGEGWI